MDLNLGRRKEQKNKIKLDSISLKWLSLEIGTVHIFTYKLNDSNRFPKLYE